MCQHREDTLVNVLIPADLSCIGVARWKETKIDHCIAPIVKALQEAEINMRGSCCGHGRSEGYIHLEDGRYFLILPNRRAALEQRFTLSGNAAGEGEVG